MIASNSITIVAGICLHMLIASSSKGQAADGAKQSLTRSPGVRVVGAEAASKSLAHPEHLIDGNVETEFTFQWANGGASVTIDLARPCVISSARLTNGQTDRLIWVREISVGPDPQHLRKLLGRSINLPKWRGRDAVTIPLQPSVGQSVCIAFAAGGPKGAIAEVELFGRENFPERHLMCWSGDVQRDFLSKIDYLDRELGVTDLWLDYVETAFPQTNHNSGFRIWQDTGALEAFKKRGLRYWLGEHEAFTFMVNGPEDLRDERRWLTTLRQMHDIYAKARSLGFRGLVMDAEDYGGVSEVAKEKYKDVADHVDAWTFADEFGLAGMYYHRGTQVGRVIREVWGGPVMQVYEARMYAGKNDCRQGNYWWLKGIHDAGNEIWIASEKTYGAGQGEIESQAPEYVRRWFVRMEDFIAEAHDAYPFATRVLPGFTPWNTRLRTANYLPKYLDQQLTVAQRCALGYWIYNEGNAHAGDPRDVLDRDFCQKYNVTAEQYLEIFSRHPTSRRLKN